MKLKQLGQTTLKVSPIGIGTAALGRPGYITIGHAEDLASNYEEEVMKNNAFNVLNRAYDLGIRHFDTARSYGLGEAFLSEWLKNTGYQDVIISSKWGYTYTANWQVEATHHEVKEHSLTKLQEQWLESKSLLANHLNIYQIHSATLASKVLENKAVLSELAKIKEEGMYIGLSLSGVDQKATLEKAFTIQIDGKHLFDTVQVTWNLLENATTSLLQQVHEAGWGVIVKEAFANGRLTARNQNPAFASAKTLLHHIAEKHQVTIDAIAMAFVLKQPWVGVVLSGTATMHHLEENIKSLQVNLDEEDLQQLESLKEKPEVYWGIRKELAWN